MPEQTKRDKQNARLSALMTERSSFVPHWKELSDYLLPRSGRFFTTDRNSGTKRHNLIYDSTGTKAVRTLGAGLLGGGSSPARPWMRLAVPDKDLMKHAPVKVWLNLVTRAMLDIFQRSNTYRSLHTMYEGLGTFGTTASFMMDDFDRVVHHYPLPIGEYCLAANYKGDIDTIYREFDKTVGALVEEFGLTNCSQTVRNLYDRGAYDQYVTIIHAVEPRRDRDLRKKDARNMAFSSCYFEKGQNEHKYLRESGMRRFRVLAPRWAVTSGSVYGDTCPGMEALGDVKQLQHQQIRKAEGIDYMTRPPLQVPSSMKNRELDRLPGGVSFIDTAAPNGGVRTMFDVNLNLQHLLLDIQDVRQRIREAFYSDLFLMLANDVRSGVTATEIAERHEEKLLMLGPVLERVHNELYDPLVEMTFERMVEAGIVPPPPEELQGQDLNVEYVSMLAQAQRAVNTTAVDRYVGNLGVIAGMKPNVLDKFDEDKWAESYADMLGVDPELIVADDKVAFIRKQRAEAQAMAQRTAMAEQTATAANKLGNTPTDNKNALTDVTRMFSGYTT